MFCPKCGSKDVVDVFCANCLREEKPLVTGFKEFLVEVCISCGCVHHRYRWHATDDPHARLAELFQEHLVFPNYADIKKVEVAPLEFDMKSGLLVNGEAKVTGTGRASKKAKDYEEEYAFPFKIQNTVCKKCSRLGTQYFEGTLQVRNETRESVKFLKEYLKHTSATIAKEEREKNGTDYYLTVKAEVERTARALQERFGGAIRSSARLFSRNKMTSKDIYRVTWFVELPPFAAGDVVQVDEAVLMVLELGKRIRFFNPARGKTEFHEYTEDGRWEKVPIFETTVSSTKPTLMVLHPETFDEVEVCNAHQGEHRVDERVNVFLDGKKAYIVEKRLA